MKKTVQLFAFGKTQKEWNELIAEHAGRNATYLGPTPASILVNKYAEKIMTEICLLLCSAAVGETGTWGPVWKDVAEASSQQMVEENLEKFRCLIVELVVLVGAGWDFRTCNLLISKCMMLGRGPSKYVKCMLCGPGGKGVHFGAGIGHQELFVDFRIIDFSPSFGLRLSRGSGPSEDPSV